MQEISPRHGVRDCAPAVLNGRHRGIASPVFSYRGSASQMISGTRTHIAKIFASHRTAISVFSTHCHSHRLQSPLCTLHFTKTPTFPGILWKIWRRNTIFQAISDISEPVLGRHHYFSWDIWPFSTLNNPPKPLTFQKTFIFVAFFGGFEQNLVFPRFFCNFDPFLRKHPLKTVIFLIIAAGWMFINL